MSFAADEQLWFFALLLTVPRILGAFLAMPFLGSSVLPGLVRNGLIMVISAFATPITLQYAAELPMDDTLYIAFIIVKETALGFMLGYLISLPFYALSTAGFFLDLQRGVLSAQIFSNVLAGQTSLLGDFFAKLAVALLFTTGGFLILVEVLLSSYSTWPVHSFIPTLDIQDAGIFLKQFSLMFYTGILIAAPIIATMYLTEIGAAIVARYVPQLNIFLLMMPIKSGIAILLLIFYITYISQYVREEFLRFGDVFRLLDGILT